MNWLDIIFIIINIFVIMGLFVWVSICTYEDGILGFVFSLIPGLFVCGLTMVITFCLPFLVLDKGKGYTIGTITSVDKNFFGTTALYIKTSETEQEKYCIEFDKKLENKAKKLIGKNVKISYGERVGLYSTGKCKQAPVEKIELEED